jgi:hypothetical protein
MSDIHDDAAVRQRRRETVKGLLVTLGVLVAFGLLLWAIIEGTDARRRQQEAAQLRYWTFQAQQIGACRKAGGFPVEQIKTYGTSESVAFVSCSFPPRCP